MLLRKQLSGWLRESEEKMNLTISHKPLNREEISAMFQPLKKMLVTLDYYLWFVVISSFAVFIADVLLYHRLEFLWLLFFWLLFFLLAGKEKYRFVVKLLSGTPLFPVEHQIHFGDDAFSIDLPDYRLSCDYSQIPQVYLTHIPSSGEELLLLGGVSCLPILRKSDLPDTAAFTAVLEKLRTSSGKKKEMPMDILQGTSLVIPFHLPARRSYSLVFQYLLWEQRWQIILMVLVTALGIGVLLLNFKIPYGTGVCAGAIYVLAGLAGSLALKMRRKWKQVEPFLPEDFRFEIDLSQKILRETTPCGFKETSFRRIRKCSIFRNWLVLECSVLERYFLPRNAFPSKEAFQHVFESAQNAVKAGQSSRVEMIPPGDELPPEEKKKKERRGCCLICCIAALLLATVFGVAAYKVYYNVISIFRVDEVLDSEGGNPEDFQELSKALNRLEKALQTHAPGLVSRRHPLSPDALKKLQNALPGEIPSAVTLWYMTISGWEGYQLIPEGEVVGLEDALEIRKLSGMPVVRITAPYRAKSLMLLHDGSGDGFFYGLEKPWKFVYADFLEHPGIDFPYGSMIQFISAIAEAVEEKFWTYDANGNLIAEDDSLTRFQEKLSEMRAGQRKK